MRTISDRRARFIACEWHGGQASPLYALCSSGAITDECAHEILCDCNKAIAGGQAPAGKQVDRDLDALLRYVDEHGPRGPQDGWSTR